MDEPPPSVKPEPKKEEPKFFFLNSRNCVDYIKDYGAENPETKVQITTKFGVMKIRLYEETPLHRANFIMLVKKGYFNDSYFYRVAKNFIIQGGDSDSEAQESKRAAIGQYLLPHEMTPEFFHKKGALCAARSYNKNPDKLSDPYNFYIVQGERVRDGYMDQVEEEYGIEIPAKLRQIYKTKGGAPHLDGEHTVFGEVYEGMSIIDKIAAVEVDNTEWPKDDIVMQVEIIEE